ncbi:MAG: transketolase C-terminal domain-containing protein [Patescibacteria group bacterium]
MNDPKLNPRVYELGVEQVPIRKGFGEGLVTAGERNDKVVGLCADLTESTQMLAFKNKFPNRFVEIGVAEQNLAAVASGLAAMGKIPFITSYAMFSPGRNWEQIRTTICYNDRPVKIIGSHAGVSVGPDGGTHQAIEDIAITRVIPRMQVIVPCDAIEAKKATMAIAETSSPTYLRLAREKTPVVTTEESPFKIGQGNILVDYKKPAVAIFACGPMVYNALIAVKKLLKEGIEVSVINLHTIKPLDKTLIELMAKKAGAILTVEEHQKHGGMGSAVAEWVVERAPVPMTLMGVNDQFGQSGTPLELIEHYGLGIDAIVEKTKKLISKK